MISPFKINLGLHILDKRNDGYHNIETCMYPILKGDTVSISESRSGGLELHESGIIANCSAEQNLVIQAFRILQSEYGFKDMALHLHKELPFGAGIGGGSANAATVLKLVNTQFNLELSDSILESIATRIGADCPIFIQNKPQYCVGIGTEFQPIKLPDLSQYHIVVIHPGFGISTAEAYSSISPNSDRVSLKKKLELPITEWQEHLINDFQKPMEQKYPIISEIKQWMLSNGAIYSAMSGSGSAVLGLFQKEPQEIPKFTETQVIV